ncbi:HNH endonuclease [Micromonospora sp. DT201]|uniref:HNH endonuclease n=1 Tax=Micromonospora sp. DT201 TaxID=3393442 RepID=UPI003CF7CD29
MTGGVPQTRNGHLAGKDHPVTGVPFDRQGFPDFSAWRHPTVLDVRITLTGSRSRDFTAANNAAGLRSTPSGYTWHHHQDRGLMQLVDRQVHAKTGHNGGF